MPTAIDQAAAAAAAAAAGVWIDQSAAATAGLKDSATGAATAAWGGFTGWYSAEKVAQQAQDMSVLSTSAQDAVTAMFARYVAELVAMLRGETRVDVPDVRLQPVRRGADLVRVHARPAEVFKENFALVGDEFTALERSIQRSVQLIETDIMLAARQAQQDAMVALEVTHYRRVLRPELSDSGPCGLCVVASDRIYKVSDLLPLHDRCACQTVPVVEGLDPGARINAEDLKRLYAGAGSSGAADLKRTRVSVNEHGELGPVLTTRGHRFTGPEDLGQPVDPDRGARRLTKLQDVLEKLEQRSGDGENLDAPIVEQRDRIAAATTARSAPGTAGAGQGGAGGSDDSPPTANGSPDEPEDGSDWLEGFPFAGRDVEHPDLSRLTQDEVDAIAYYASLGHDNINRTLEGDVPMTPETAGLIASIRSGLRKYPLPSTIRVSRETELTELGIDDYDQLARLRGQVIDIASFISTSVAPNPPRIRVRRQPVVLDLVVVAGTPALRIVASLAEPGQEHERELLLIDGRRLSVFGVVFDQSSRRWRVRAYVRPGD